MSPNPLNAYPESLGLRGISFFRGTSVVLQVARNGALEGHRATSWNTQSDDSGLDVDGRLAGLSRSCLLALGGPDALALSGLQDLLIK